MITRMTHENINDYNKSNESLVVFGRIIPIYENGNWTYTEEIFSEQYIKKYDNNDVDVSYIEDKNKAVFFYYESNHCIGQIRLRTNWNGFAFVEDIAVASDWRLRGVGTELLMRAKEWATQNNQLGLMLETQDVNLSACRFYTKNNFVIGGVDTMLYTNFSTKHEKAIFWYYKF
ncbi:GNAT family N-acetyltransferase [Cohnella caldifontis]|uniref:GNAT family N-acetyltransferase n=1 Tax=Cohnella caldifontis TaxID=3027471 RepID=UPI0023ECCF24|nr:GNAT family N-acetyltransferase [Cohnella sp. YIM B05605]